MIESSPIEITKMNKYATRFIRIFQFNIEITYRPNWLENQLHSATVAAEDWKSVCERDKAKQQIKDLEAILGNGHPEILRLNQVIRLQEIKKNRLTE